MHFNPESPFFQFMNTLASFYRTQRTVSYHLPAGYNHRSRTGCAFIRSQCRKRAKKAVMSLLPI